MTFLQPIVIVMAFQKPLADKLILPPGGHIGQSKMVAARI